MAVSTQILFDSRAGTANCHHCGGELDSAQHTLEECPAWASERRVLVAKIGRDLSLPAVVRAMLADAENWREVAPFCETALISSITPRVDPVKLY
ncbi:hypothetical protein HW555_002556 [Spodoptera exigua]|uniref:Reverse transcriptase n=1 Tax=Spodoptera exigua TaxID=7107 RepID=A0A835LEA5_SPOEX|nr:hypothetical protein HW555_002556 [Spodoptera exigua]